MTFLKHDLIDQVKFASSYSFKYSPRPGTSSSLKHLNIIDEQTQDLRLKDTNCT